MIFKAVFLSLCILALSCQSAPPVKPPAIWPQPPDPRGQVFLLSEDHIMPAGTVVMTQDFWELLASYVVAVEELRLREQGMRETSYK